ncbi:MAG TPA: hypothetical protein VLH84_02270 [Patescibacteria group bacterium]|nr:hypothetical protein [Patescibacteria group bacterium]
MPTKAKKPAAKKPAAKKRPSPKAKVAVQAVASPATASAANSQNMLVMTALFAVLCIVFAVLVYWRYVVQ